jgi:hypothetical protein
LRIMATAIERHDFIVSHVLDQFEQLGIFAEEMLPRLGTTIGLEILHLTVNHFVHALLQ